MSSATQGPISTSESVPPKPAARKLVVRIAISPSGQAIITERDSEKEKLVMYAPFERVKSRFRADERVAFFCAELNSGGILEIGERAPREKEWDVYVRKVAEPKRLGPAPGRCVCGALQHQGMCRDALALMHGRRDPRWRALGMG